MSGGIETFGTVVFNIDVYGENLLTSTFLKFLESVSLILATDLSSIEIV